MKDNTLNWACWLPRVHEGQHNLSLLSRKIIFNVRLDLFERLDFEDDFTFLEPLLFSAFASPEAAVEMESLVVGYICSEYSPFKFSVRSNKDQTLVIPAIGSRKFAQEEMSLLAEITDENRHLVDIGSSDNNELCFVPDLKTSIDNFTIYQEIHYLLYPLFKFVDETVGPVCKKDLVGVKYSQLLERGLKLISTAYPDFFSALSSVTRGFLVFRQHGMNSYYSESAHGISFLSVPDFVSIPYFVEDIAHQCGHIIFNSMFFRHEELLADPERSISQFSHDPEDSRSAFILFHAVFTEHVIAICLLSFLESDQCSDEEREETVGRLAFIMKKYEIDLHSLKQVDGLTKVGEIMRTELEGSFKKLYSYCHYQIADISLAGQPYNFDFNKYKEINLR